MIFFLARFQKDRLQLDLAPSKKAACPMKDRYRKKFELSSIAISFCHTRNCLNVQTEFNEY